MGLCATVHVFDKNLELKEKERVENIQDYALRWSFYYASAKDTYGDSDVLAYMEDLSDVAEVQAILNAEQVRIEAFIGSIDELSEGCWWTVVRVSALTKAALDTSDYSDAIAELTEGLLPDDLLLICGDTWLM